MTCYTGAKDVRRSGMTCFTGAKNVRGSCMTCYTGAKEGSRGNTRVPLRRTDSL